MGRISRMEQVVNSTLTGYSHVKIMPRGLPLFSDQLLRGTARFAKRTGNTISVFNPDNTYKITSNVTAGSSQILLDRNPTWMTPDVLVTLGPEKELAEVDDIIDNQIFLKTEVTQTYTAITDKVLLFAFPLVLSVDASNGDTQVYVKSYHKLGNGDTFCYLQTPGLLLSIFQIRVKQATYLGTTTDPYYSNFYSLELEKPVNRNIKTGEVCYFRAFPAYFSSNIRVPNAIFTTEPIGPFLLDFLSGNLLEGSPFKETFAIKTLNKTGGYILGDVGNYVTVDKNYLVVERPFTAHFPMFWDLGEGIMHLASNKLLMKVSDKMQFAVNFRCVPHIPKASTVRQWRVNLRSSDDATIRFQFHPNPWQEFSLLANFTTSVVLTLPALADVENLEINILGTNPTTEVTMSDWTPVSDTASDIQYSIVVEAIGEATYQASGLIIKPYFLGPELLKTQYDIGSIYDGGKVYL